MQQEENLTVDENSESENIEEGQTKDQPSEVVTYYEDETSNNEQNVSIKNYFKILLIHMLSIIGESRAR